MDFITNLILSAVLIISALCLIAIYGSSMIGFVVLIAFTFLGILIVLVANHREL